MAMGRIDDLLQNPHHRRVERIVQTSNPAVIPIHRQQVLGQIVGPYRPEIYIGSQLRQYVENGGDFDHGSQHGVTHTAPLASQLFGDFQPGLIQQASCRLNFGQ